LAVALAGVVLFLPGVISDDTAAHDLSADVEKVVDKPARAGRLKGTDWQSVNKPN
jgi:UPF0716 family protein affecting phage T7 exclusion